MPADLLTLTQVADTLRLSRRSVNDLVLTNRLPAKAYGGQWLVRLEDVLKLAARRRAEPPKRGNPNWRARPRSR